MHVSAWREIPNLSGKSVLASNSYAEFSGMYSTTTFWGCGVTLFPLWLVALLRIIFCNSFHLVRNSCLLHAHGHAPRRRPPPHAFVLFWNRLTFVGQFPLLPLPLPPLLVRWTRLAFLLSPSPLPLPSAPAISTHFGGSSSLLLLPYTAM